MNTAGDLLMQANTFDAVERRVSITIFKLGKLWIFKQFFDKREVFDALLDYYSKNQYRFEFKSIGARNNALKILERKGFDYDLVESLLGYVVDLPKSAKYALDPEELRGLQGDGEREDFPHEGLGRRRGGGGPGRGNARRGDGALNEIYLILKN